MEVTIHLYKELTTETHLSHALILTPRDLLKLLIDTMLEVVRTEALGIRAVATQVLWGTIS